jgi:hypothetical protein
MASFLESATKHTRNFEIIEGRQEKTFHREGAKGAKKWVLNSFASLAS